MSNAEIIPFPTRDQTDRPVVRGGTVPHAAESERDVLGAMLMDRDAIRKAASMLVPGDFYRDRHRAIFTLLCEMDDNGIPVDLSSVVAEQRRIGVLEDDGVAYLETLIVNCPSSANIASYAKYVLEASLLRQQLSMTEIVAGKAYGHDATASDVQELAERTILEIGKRMTTGQPIITNRDLVEQVMTAVMVARETPGETTGLNTGFRELDKMTGGVMPDDLVIIGAQSGMGKTSLVNQIAYREAERITDGVVAFFSMEMSPYSLMLRRICCESSVDSNRAKLGLINDVEFSRMEQAAQRTIGANIEIDGTPANTLRGMRGTLRRLEAERGAVKLIIVDYLQKMSSEPRIVNRVHEVGSFVRGLKDMAKEFHCPVIALSQLSRKVDDRDNKRPQKGDLKETGDIEYEADHIWLMWRKSGQEKRRDKEQGGNGEEDKIAELEVAKQRNGREGVVKLVYLEVFTRFENLANESNY